MKYILVAAVALLALSTTSCRKSYTCECTFIDNNFGSTRPSSPTTEFRQVEAKTKNKAEDNCDDLEYEYQNASCELQ